MANNQKKLKAFVRYDGSGRVVASSLILRKNKPRVGRWYEIPEYLCCNGVPSSTTTTTTQGGGSTPTAFTVPFWSSGFDSCNFAAEGNIIIYSASSVLTAGSYVYFDAALTQPVTSSYAIIHNTIRYSFPAAPGELVVYNCPSSQTINVNITNGNCGTVIANQTVNLLYTPTLCSTNESIPVLTGNFSALTNPFYVTYNGISSLFNKISDTVASGSYDFPCVDCSSTTTTTTTQGVNSAVFGQSSSSFFVCTAPINLTLYWIGQLTNNTQIFTDQARTQPYLVNGYIVNGSTNEKFVTSNGVVFNNGSC